MRRLGLWLLFAACTPGSRLDPGRAELPSPAAGTAGAAVRGEAALPGLAIAPAAALASVAGPTAAAVREPVVVATPEVAPLPEVIAAVHDEPIATLAATEDGGVVVSLDRRGGLRLWPSLDGAHEPVIVRSEALVDRIAIARDGREIVIGAAGPLGQLELIRTSARGEPVSHTRVDLGRTLVGLAATPGRFIGLRDDQTVVAVDLRGERVERLVVPAGERVVGMAGRRGGLIAFVNVAGSLRARRIEAGGPLAWGGEGHALQIDPDHAVLAPDRKRVAAVTRDHTAIVIVDLASGHTLERPLTMEAFDPACQPLGFIDDHTLEVQTAEGTLAWWRHGELTASERFGVGPTVAADHHVITASASSLILDTPDARRHLGFRVVTLTSAQPHGNGWTVSDGASALRIDDRLRVRRRYLPRDGEPDHGRSLILLDGRRAVLWTPGGTSLIDLEHPADGELLSSMTGTISYEPATHLLAIAGDAGQWFGRYNPRTHGIDARVDVPGEPHPVALLDPELNGGAVALVLAQDGQDVTITEIRKIDFAAAWPLREGRTYRRRLPDEPWGVTADPVVQLGLTAAGRHHVSPDGALVAVAGHDRITLRDREGAVRWSVVGPGVIDVGWSALGELFAFGSGMARVDTATGALLERQCGWDFGLWDDDASSETAAKLCEAP